MTNQNRKFVFEIDMPVRWYDMDAFGHVNNSVYLTYFEQARLGWWNSITPPDVSYTHEGPVVINAYCTFFKAIHYPEVVTVKMYVGPAGRSSYECYYTIHSKSQPDIQYAEGSTKVVWVDRKQAHSIPLPDYIKNHLPEQ